MLVAIAMQESALITRQQISGSAISPYQFEQIGIDNVFTHADTGQLVTSAAKELAIPVDENFYDAVKWNDAMATVIARLILWPDPAMLPALGKEVDARSYYERTWRPGIKSSIRWTTSYGAAVACVRSVP